MSEPFSFWERVALAFHFLSFACLAFFLLCFVQPIDVIVLDTVYGPGMSTDAQGGAFGLIWILLGLLLSATLFHFVGAGIGIDTKSRRRTKWAYINGLAILIVIVLVLFVGIFSALLHDFISV